jgi:hypothetical protein
MVMPAFSSAASTVPTHPETLMPPSVTAREPSAVGLPGPPTKRLFAMKGTKSNATRTSPEPIMMGFFFIRILNVLMLTLKYLSCHTDLANRLYSAVKRCQYCANARGFKSA